MAALGLHRRSVFPRARRHANCPDLDGPRLDRRRTGVWWTCHGALRQRAQLV